MPHVNVKLWPGRTDQQKRKLTERIVEAMQEEMGIREASVSVAFEEVPRERWIEEVYEPEIAEKRDLLTKEPGYDPEDI